MEDDRAWRAKSRRKGPAMAYDRYNDGKPPKYL